MRLLVYSYFPIREKHQAGGAQMLMHDLLFNFVRAGIDVTVICPEIKENEILQYTENLEILPVLKEAKGEEICVSDQFHNLQQLANAIQYTDVVWTLDRSFPLDIPQPIVLTLGTIAYGIEVESFLRLNWDMLIVPSRYIWNIVNLVAGPETWDDSPPPIKLIPNGISTTLFSQSDPSSLYSRLGLSRTKKYLLFPHRPDPDKGFYTAFEILRELLERGYDYELLIPTNPRSIQSELERETQYYEILYNVATKMDIHPHVVFHEWLSLNDLPEYFSLGEWTLSLSIVPEGFGLTPVQSISCGTPVISTRAGALQELFPLGHGVKYVRFNAMDDIISSILSRPSYSEIEQGIAYVRDHYSIDKCAESYINCFRTAKKKLARYNPAKRIPGLRLSPWCFFYDEKSVWHDFKMQEYCLTNKELDLLTQIEARVSVNILLKQYRSELINLLSKGIVVGLNVEVKDIP